MTPEVKARIQIDQKLEQAGWIVQDRKQINLGAGLGVVVREYPTDTGPADYVMFVNREPIGVIEAKRDEAGENLTVVEAQTERYAQSTLKWKVNSASLRFLFESTGQITRYTDGRDPAPRSREIFHFFKPEQLAEWLSKPDSFRRRLAEQVPELPIRNLRDCQISAVTGLEKSLAQNKPRALVHTQLQEQFNDCLQKAKAMFTSKGLNDLTDYRWERALLCIGDYLLPRGRNYSFLVNSQTDQASWKRLLRGTGPGVPDSRKKLRELWKLLNGTNNLAVQLDAIIAGTDDLDPWRDAFVRTPAAISYCYQRLIRWNNQDEIYLLQTTQMNGTHAELYTYCLYKNKLVSLSTGGHLEPLKLLPYYEAINTELDPGISLKFFYDNNWLRFEIEFQNGQFVIYISIDNVTPYPLFEEALVERLEFKKNHNYRKECSPETIESAVLSLAEQMKFLSSP